MKDEYKNGTLSNGEEPTVEDLIQYYADAELSVPYEKALQTLHSWGKGELNHDA